MKTILAALTLSLGLGGAASAQQGNPGQHFLDQWDADSDSRVTAIEVVAKRSEVFSMFDQDDDKTLSVAEWGLVAEHMALEQGQGMGGHGMNRAAPGQAVHEAMTPAFNDADGDGIVTMEEFDTASVKLFPLMDANGDGAVTIADFAR
ncbi:EF-hand domain-containing protein [Tabrizicola sp.]|uniref:EF-hand domain-containing protein n=1 Tax=Tabrizicola sp. TaxID=2005166 RepID=UPI00261AB109|nr:EF-hand domain-containing protein [Tabrizicola sp.]MDM7931431.1 EF-hand domain-containing protein [Tabrizicola sp.]